MAEKSTETGIAAQKVGYKSPPVATRFVKGNQVRKGWRKPADEEVPVVVDLPSAQDLATPHVQRAVEVLVGLLGHKNAFVRRNAALDLIKLAEPDVNDAKIQKAVDEKLQALFEEAQAARAGEKRGIETTTTEPTK